MRAALFNFLLAGLGAAALPTSEFQPVQNANHIFNAIHDSMRQFGSSLHHNGMSFFLANVPEGIHLYHGNASPEYLKEIGWMAFEPEHGMVFARPEKPGQHRDINDQGAIQDGNSLQKPLSSNPTQAADDKSDGNISGYLHTYKTANPLRLLYIDGTSAGKSRIGTLDSQNRILFNDTINGGVSVEDKRARSVCRLAENEWKGRLDGVIRMAAGFEIILCKPEVNLVPVRVMPVEKHPTDGNGNRNDNGRPRGKPAALLRAITSRFNGIGGDRVVLNYNNFVTAYTYDLDLFPNNENGTETRPRLDHIPTPNLEPIRQDLTTLIMDHDVNDNKPNWQSVADLIVGKYAPILRDLAPRTHHDKHKSKGYHKPQNKENPAVKIAEILSPFSSPSKNETLSLCASQFLSTPNLNSTLSQRALYSISQTICSTLLSLQSETDQDVIHSSILELMKSLDWTSWKECRGCKSDEFCAVPIWPNGSEEDFEKPRCERLVDAWEGRSGYWGGVWH
ncbi:uncharacterized protein BDV14DRAFT_190105 [Aspergillus stella-maris]|uniref:uncharacterized protein n=1 Tax=Aspergillus stella-maris TaxID=1810926 RepID=UPI003CCCAF40